MDLKKLGTKIRTKREEIGIPPSILAEKTGIRRPTLWIYERGENPKTGKPSRPSKDKLERLAEVLHMSQGEAEELLSLADYHVTRQPSQASNHISAATKTDTTQQASLSLPATITEINGIVYYAHDGYLEAFDAKTGNRLWSSPTEVSPMEPTPASVSGRVEQTEPSTLPNTVEQMKEDFQKAVEASKREFREFLLAKADVKASEPQAPEVTIEDSPPLSPLSRPAHRIRRPGGAKPTPASLTGKTQAAAKSATPDQPGAEAQTPTVSSSPVVSDISGEVKLKVKNVLERNCPVIFLGPDFTIQAANLLAIWLIDTTDPSDPAFDKTAVLGRKLLEVCNRKEFVKRIILGTQEKDYVRLLKTLGEEHDSATIAGFEHLIESIPGLQVKESGKGNTWLCMTIMPPSQLKNSPEFFNFEMGVFPIFRDFAGIICEGYIVVLEPSFEDYEWLLRQESDRLKNLPGAFYAQWWDEDAATNKAERDEQPLLLQQNQSYQAEEKRLRLPAALSEKRGAENEELQRLLQMEVVIQAHVVGQDEAIEKISQAVRRAYTGLKDPKLPLGSFLMLGPSDYGKTELAKALAEFMYGDDDAITVIDTANWLDIPENVKRLTIANRRFNAYGELNVKLSRVFVLNNIEKVHADDLNILLHILKDGMLTDSNGRSVDFSNTIFIMSSNIGTELFDTVASHSFKQSKAKAKAYRTEYEAITSRILDQVKHTFEPEFLNCIDEVIVFQPLYREDMYALVELLLKRFQRKLAEHQVDLAMPQATRDYLIEQIYDTTYCADFVHDIMQRLVEDRLVESLIKGKFNPGDQIEAIIIDDELDLRICNREKYSPDFYSK